MPLDLGNMRYAHCEGYTDVCYDNNGRYLITCGSDGDVRIYDGFDDDDPKSFRAGEEVTAVAFQDNRILAGADCAVKIYTFPEGTPDGMITRFPATVNSLCCSKSGNYLAAGASDFNIKVVEVQNSSHKLLKGHEAPILCVAMDQNEEFLVSSSCDGTVKIWNWKEQKCLRSLSLLQKSNDFSVAKSLCKLEFQPKENGCLAIPVAKEIKIYEKETWKLLYALKVDDSGSGSQSVSIVKWSPCGNYLASATINGEFLIWSIKTKQVVERAQHEKSLPITSLVWNPTKSGEIAYTDNQGQLGLCTDVIPSDLTVQKTNVVDPLNAMANEFIDDDDNRSETESLLGVKNRGRLKKSWLDDEADEDDDDDDDNITDLGKIKAELAGPMGLDVDDDMTLADSMKNVTETNIDSKPVVFQQPQTFQQQPFQPGSTPVHLMHRFMVWNHVGIVRSHSEEEPASIDVEFHDSNLHHSMNLINELNHTMAALSNQAVLLACQANDEIPSKLVCLHFGTWDRSKEWSVAMPQGEDIMAIAVGSSWAAAITNQDLLRVFTIGGLQKALISVPGPVVCMSGFGTQLIVVYHSGVGVAGSQCLAVKLIDLETNTQVLCDQRLPLSPKANLSWLGFSLEGTPSTVDSLGVVRLLNRSLDNTWINVANTKTEVKRSSDNYWVVGITETSQQIRCVLCTGSTYPPTLPRPLISSLSLKLPVCEVDTEKGQLEENYLRWRLLMNRYDHESERGVVIEEELYEQNKTHVKQLLMKIFALSCKTERDFRAREVCELLPDAYSVSLAIKYASRNRRMNLAQRLDEVALHKAEEEAANQHEQFDDMYNIKEETGRRRSDLFERESKQRNHVVEEYEDDTKNDEKCNESFESPLQVSTTPKASRFSLSKRLPNFHHRFYHQDTPQRCNPFKVNKEKSTANDSSISFFENVENDRQTAKTLDKKSPTESTKSKASKQIKLFSKKKRNDNKQESKVDEVKTSTKPTEKAITTKPKKNAFQCWLDVMKPFFADENPEMSEGEIMKIAVKQWRETPKEEKQVWERNSTSAPSMNIMCDSQEDAEDVTGAGGKKINEFESKVSEMQHESEIDEKKRKRNEDGNERIIGDISDEKENISKKVKTFDKQKVNSKLSTFSFTK